MPRITVMWNGKAYPLDGKAAAAVVELVRQREVVGFLDRVPCGSFEAHFRQNKAPRIILHLNPDSVIDN